MVGGEGREGLFLLLIVKTPQSHRNILLDTRRIYRLVEVMANPPLTSLTVPLYVGNFFRCNNFVCVTSIKTDCGDTVN